MSAATADRDAKRSEGRLKSYPVAASTTIYKGTLVGLDSSGYLLSLAHGTSGLTFAGVAEEKIDNSTGSNGDKSCRVRKDGEFEFVYNGGDAAQANVGDEVYALDDQTVDEDPATVTNQYKVGEVVECESATKLRICISGYTGKPASQTAIVSLTDSSGGTANDTLQAVGATNGGDVSAAINNNFADVSAKINGILTALRNAGILAS
jgi:hypothetical protein